MHILFFEKDLVIDKQLRIFAERHDIEAYVTDSPEQALHIAKSTVFDAAVIVNDAEFGSSEGAHLAAALRRLHAELPIVLVFNSSIPRSHEGDAELHKPYSPSSLIEAIGNAIMARRFLNSTGG